MNNIENAQALETEIINNKLVLIDFWAEWCAPCKAFSPIFEDFARTSVVSMRCLKVNIDNNQDIAVKYEVRSIPTIILIKDGNVVDRKVGLLNKATLEAWVEKFSA